MKQNDLPKNEAVISILLDWADWQERYKIKTGMPRATIGLRSGGTVNEDSSASAYESMIAARCKTVDKCIDELPPNQNAAIHHKYLHAVYRMRDFEKALADAHDALAIAFRRRNVVF